MQVSKQIYPVGLDPQMNCAPFSLEVLPGNSRPGKSELSQGLHDCSGILCTRIYEDINILGCPYVAVIIDGMASNEHVHHTMSIEQIQEIPHVAREVHYQSTRSHVATLTMGLLPQSSPHILA